MVTLTLLGWFPLAVLAALVALTVTGRISWRWFVAIVAAILLLGIGGCWYAFFHYRVTERVTAASPDGRYECRAVERANSSRCHVTMTVYEVFEPQTKRRFRRFVHSETFDNDSASRRPYKITCLPAAGLIPPRVQVAAHAGSPGETVVAEWSAPR